MEAVQTLNKSVDFSKNNVIQFEELEEIATPVDPWVAGYITGGSFATGVAIGAAIAT